MNEPDKLPLVKSALAGLAVWAVTRRGTDAVLVGTLVRIALSEQTYGAVGLLTRRNVLVMFMCVELMLNACNLALVAFAKQHGNLDGQVAAFFVMVVAAAEVVAADSPLGLELTQQGDVARTQNEQIDSFRTQLAATQQQQADTLGRAGELQAQALQRGVLWRSMCFVEDV